MLSCSLLQLPTDSAAPPAVARLSENGSDINTLILRIEFHMISGDDVVRCSDCSFDVFAGSLCHYYDQYHSGEDVTFRIPLFHLLPCKVQ